MKRRDFLRVLAGIPLIGGLFITTTAPALAGPGPAPLPVPSRPVLPPTKRQFALACVRCGKTIATIILDECDRTPGAACARCFEKAEDEATSYPVYPDDDLEAELDALRVTHKALVKTNDRVAAQLRDLQFDATHGMAIPPEHLRNLEDRLVAAQLA